MYYYSSSNKQGVIGDISNLKLIYVFIKLLHQVISPDYTIVCSGDGIILSIIRDSLLISLKDDYQNNINYTEVHHGCLLM